MGAHGGTDNSESDDGASNVDNNESEETGANTAGEQPSASGENLSEPVNTDDAVSTSVTGPGNTTNTENQSANDSLAQTSGAGAADKYLLLFLICLLGRVRTSGVLDITE